LVAVCEADSVCTIKSCTGSGQVDATQCPTDGQFCVSGVCTVCADTGSTQCTAANQNCNSTTGGCANIVCDTSVTTYTNSACFASSSVCVADGATGTAGNCQLCSSASGIACGTGYSCDDVMNGTSTGACIVDQCTAATEATDCAANETCNSANQCVVADCTGTDSDTCTATNLCDLTTGKCALCT